MTKIRANSEEDISALSIVLCTLPEWFVLAHVHDLGLMRCRQQPLGMLMGLVRRFRGANGLMSFFAGLKERNPDVLSMWFADTLHHMHFGEDTEDTDSVGGWSQREIDMLVARIPGLAS